MFAGWRSTPTDQIISLKVIQFSILMYKTHTDPVKRQVIKSGLINHEGGLFLALVLIRGLDHAENRTADFPSGFRSVGSPGCGSGDRGMPERDGYD
jgi:hypothetical protein